MNLVEMEEELIRDEGLRLRVYQCSAGYPTIGVGHKIVSCGAMKISLQDAGKLLHNDILNAILTVERIFGKYCLDCWSESRQRAIVNMAFNLGETRLRGFKKMIAAIKKNDWNLAAVEAKDSKWYCQVGSRAERVISQFLK